MAQLPGIDPNTSISIRQDSDHPRQERYMLVSIHGQVVSMIERRWQRIHLAGAYWWEGTAFPADRHRENARAQALKAESEEQVTELLAEGWMMVSVVGAAPVRRFQNRAGRLWQEAFTVFLEHQGTDTDGRPED